MKDDILEVQKLILEKAGVNLTFNIDVDLCVITPLEDDYELLMLSIHSKRKSSLSIHEFDCEDGTLTQEDLGSIHAIFLTMPPEKKTPVKILMNSRAPRVVKSSDPKIMVLMEKLEKARILTR